MLWDPLPQTSVRGKRFEMEWALALYFRSNYNEGCFNVKRIALSLSSLLFI